MTRNEVIEGLTVLLARSDLDWTLSGWHDADAVLVREALALLTPPTTSEIEAVRRWLTVDREGNACCNKTRDMPDYDNSGCESLACTDCPPRATCLRALDALVCDLTPLLKGDAP